MAISPKQLEAAFQDEVNAYEESIDKQLSKEKITTGGTVGITPPRGMSTQHFNFLRLRYIAAGWKDVVYNSDQRDGDWLSFKN
jgi:hypothetical protein